MGLHPGDIIDDKYRIVRLIGEGGMGAVYEGENTRIHRRVAIKVLHAGVSAMPEVVARFEREAQAAGRIGSEHIVEVLDLGTLRSGDRYMVMEFMDGDSLSQRIRQRGSLQPSELYPIARQLLEALRAAHHAGIVHRDLKPDNVFLLRSKRGQSDFLKLLDFGISKFSNGPGGLSMTRTGAVMGTPYYMAPEQAKGARDVDHRVDLYAAGVILYEALAGRVPFLADTFNELLFKIVLEKPDPLLQLVPQLDPALAAIVEKAMARDPNDRYQTAEALRDALDAWAGQRPQHHAPAAPPVAPLPTAQATATTASALASTPGSWAGASAVNGEPIAKPRSNTGLVIGLAAAVVVIGGGAAAFLLRGSHAPVAAESASAPVTTTAPAVVTPPSVATVEPAVTATSTPSALPSASAASEPAPSLSAAPAVAPAATGAPVPVAKAHHTTPSPTRPAPAAPSRPATKPPEPAPPATQTAPSSGRRIRQTL